MSQGTSQFDESFGVVVATPFVAANTTTHLSVWNQKPYEARIDSMVASNTDGIVHVLSLYINQGGPDMLIGSVTVPAGAGTLGTPPFDILAALGASVATGLYNDPTTDYLMALSVSMVAASQLVVLALGGNL
jgi:hypothetical protein